LNGKQLFHQHASLPGQLPALGALTTGVSQQQGSMLPQSAEQQLQAYHCWNQLRGWTPSALLGWVAGVGGCKVTTEVLLLLLPPPSCHAASFHCLL